MNLCNINHNFDYETEKLCRLFLPFHKINVLHEEKSDEIYAVTRLYENNATAQLKIGEESVNFSEKLKRFANEPPEKTAERAVAVALYNCFCKLTGYNSRWGILTGVRPAKLYSAMLREYGEDITDNYFKNELYVDNGKIRLCKETAKSEREIVGLSNADSFSLYVSIPFCPSRCSYCSFVSHSVEKAEKLIPEYLNRLKEEIKATGEMAKRLKLRLKTVYIGGGTPTTLSAAQITELMDAVRENFDLSDILEYTVEAGRPDTLTEEKLRAILNGGATRISINPQTLNDDVLLKIGRKHTTEQFINAYNLARKVGFQNINTDLIAGLTGDTLESFKYTVDEIIKLNPENVTVHSLSLKRASNMSAEGVLPEVKTGVIAAEMVDYARDELTKAGIVPYYMYRQSKTVGNLENVGYAKPTFEGYYNVYIMDETHTILACGASAVTKMRSPYGKVIERVFNYKYPYEYITGFNEILNRKKKVEDFYKKYPLDIKG